MSKKPAPDKTGKNKRDHQKAARPAQDNKPQDKSARPPQDKTVRAPQDKVMRAPRAVRDPFNRKTYLREPDKIADPATQATLLIVAAQKGELEKCAALISAGANIEKTDTASRSALHHAIAAGHVGVVQLLLENGARTDMADKAGDTVMSLAVASLQSASMVAALIETGADVNMRGRDQRTPLHDAASKDRVDLVNLLLAAGADIDAREKSGYTPLLNAARNGNGAVVERLVFERADVFAAAHDGTTCLHLTAMGFATLTRFLLEGRAGILVNAVDHSGRTPLHIAASGGHEDACKVLVAAGAWLNESDGNGATPVHVAAEKGSLALLDLFITYGAEADHRTQKLGRTPLSAAINTGQKNAAAYLIARGADVNNADAAGLTPLMLAAARGDRDSVAMLLESGANAALTDTHGRNVLHMSMDALQPADIKSMMAAGAALEHQDENGRTPLFAALQRSQGMLANRLLDAGAKPDQADKNGSTPLMIAVQYRRSDVVEKLLKKGANANARDPATQQTLLHSACNQGMIREIALLLNAGADVSATDRQQRTPLHLAMYAGFNATESVKLMLGKGANPLARDHQGVTPYDIAMSTSKDQVADLFKQHLARKGITYTPKRVSPYPWYGGPMFF